MDASETVFRDVTGDAEAAVKARQPDWRPQLLELGFTPVGLVEARVPGLAGSKMLNSMLAGPDADLMQAVAEEGKVVEILVNSDRSTQACQEHSFAIALLPDGPLILAVVRPLVGGMVSLGVGLVAVGLMNRRAG